MSNNFVTALQITGLGMGLVFAAIILLWWMMNLLTFITADKKASSSPSATASNSAGAAPAMDGDLKAQAAAVAVAVALAEQHISIEMSRAHPLYDPPPVIVSAWQLGMRMRQLQQKGPIRRPRKLG